MNKLALTLLYLASILMFIGGLGDQFINRFLEVHLNFLGNPENSELLDKAEQLSMLLLHSTGGGLMSVGISMLALTHFAIRKNQEWAKWSFLVITWIAQGFNGYNMYCAGSHFWYSIVVLTLGTIGVFTFRITK